MSGPAARFIPCRVRRGFFETEYYVLVGKSVSAFVDRRNVRLPSGTAEPGEDDELEGEVKAYEVWEDSEGTWVELSGEPVVGGLRLRLPTAASDR